MKGYYYFLYRIYWFYKDKQNETDGQALFSVTAISTLVLVVNLISIYTSANYWGFLPEVTNKFFMILFMVVIGCVNHYLFVSDERFLNYNFQKDRKGGFLIIAFIISTFLIVFIVGKFNRERIFKEGKGVISNEPRRESLEGKIRKWLE